MQHSLRGIVYRLVFFHKTAHQRPPVFARHHLALYEKDVEFPFAEAEYHAVHSYVMAGMLVVILIHI